MMAQEETTPLTQYIKQTPIMRYKELVGEKLGRKRHIIMTEEGKRLIITLLKELYCCHKYGKCPKHFDESNVFVTSSGRAKLKDVDLDDKEDSMVFQNYQNARTIIVNTILFQGYDWDDIPKDVKHLLQLMNSQATVIDMEYVICTHASLVPLENREPFFMRMYKHIHSVLHCDKPTERESILKALPYKNYWRKKLKDNSLLEELFSWNVNKSEEPICFLKSYRNATAHDMDGYSNRRDYTSDDFQLILLVTFPMLLPRMQEELQKKKQLRDLKLDSLFGSNLPT